MKKLLIILFAGILLAGCSANYEGQSAEYWFNEYDAESAKVEELQAALQEANNNIDQANSNIDDAKYYLGGSYDDMEYALDSLDTIDTVDEPF